MNESIRIGLAGRRAVASRVAEMALDDAHEIARLREENTRLRQQLEDAQREKPTPRRFGAQLFQLSSGGIQYAVELTVKQ